MVLFGTELSVEYALGMTNVLAAVFLYNAQDLEKHAWQSPSHMYVTPPCTNYTVVTQ